MVQPLQASVNAGEFSPRMMARVDFAKYPNACEVLENMTPLPQGGGQRRAGTRFIAAVKDSAKDTRLMPFAFNTEQTYMLEVGDRYLRFFRDRGQVVLPAIGAAVSNGDFSSGLTDWDDISTGSASIALDSAFGPDVFASGTATASSFTGSPFSPPSQAIDGDTATAWQGGSPDPSVAWWQVDLGAGNEARLARIRQFYSGNNRAIDRFDLKASDTGAFSGEEVTVLSGGDFKIAVGVSGWYTVDFAAPATAYRHYRIEVTTAVTGPTQNSPNVRELEGMEAIASPDPFLNLIGAADGTAIAEQAVTTGDVGAEHVVRFQIKGLVGDVIRIRVGTSSGASDILNDVACSAGFHTVAFTPTASPFYLQFRNERAKRVSLDDVVLLSDEPLELQTPYDQAALIDSEARLQLFSAQSADVLYACITGQPVHKLVRRSDKAWALEQVDFIDGPYLETNTTEATLQPDAVTGLGITITASEPVFTADDVGRLVRITHGSSHGVALITAVSGTTEVTADVRIDFANTTASDEWRLGAWSPGTGYPESVTFFDQRLWFGGAKGNPQRLWASKSGDFETFTPGSEDDDALDFTISADQVNSINWLSPGRRLLCGTVGGEWIVQASTLDDPVTPTSISVKRHTNVGSVKIAPFRQDDQAVFVDRSGLKLHEFAFNFQADAFRSPDLTLLADHVTRGPGTVHSGIIGMAYRQNPDSQVFCVRKDGVLPTLSYLRSQDVIGWCRHTTGDGDRFRAIAVLPGGQCDEAWLVCERTLAGQTVRCIEVMEQCDFETAADAFFVDCGLTTGVNADPSRTLTLTAAQGWGPGAGGTLTASGFAPFSAGDVGGSYRLENGSAVATVTITAFTDSATVTVTFADAVPRALQGAATDDWMKGATVFSGLDHLNGEVVQILADGAVEPPQTVSGGQITLSRIAHKVQAGLAYSSVMKSAKLAVGAQGGTAVAQPKRINRVDLVLNRSFGVRVGSDDNDLKPVAGAALYPATFRTIDDTVAAAPPLMTGEVSVPIPGGHRSDPRVVIRQDQPLPLEVLAIVPHVHTHARS